MNIIKIENVKGIENCKKGITVSHDYKMDGKHSQASIVVLSYKDLENIDDLLDKLKGRNIMSVIIPEGTHISSMVGELIKRGFNKNFTVSYY